MSNTTPKKPQRKLTSLELSAPARGALRRITTRNGWTKTRTIELAIISMDLEQRELKDLQGLNPRRGGGA